MQRHTFGAGDADQPGEHLRERYAALFCCVDEADILRKLVHLGEPARVQ